MRKMAKAIGLMSGTSMDGVDVALIETDGEGAVSAGTSLTLAFSDDLRGLLWDAVEAAAGLDDRLARPEPLPQAERAITDVHGAAVESLLVRERLSSDDVDVIGFHGQTVLHRPDIGLTMQLADGARLARQTGIDVVCDLRANDMAHGGEGAPLAPVYHQALAGGLEHDAVAFLNLGGVANVTWVARDEPLMAFDTGPGNGLIDLWVLTQSGEVMDEGGRLAAAGQVDEAILDSLMSHAYFARKPPKSLDRFEFSLTPLDGMGAADGAATLTAFTAASVARAAEHLPGVPELWIACGGGRQNPTLMMQLASRLDAPVSRAETVGLRGDSLEAEAFAYLAVRAMKGLPLSFPTTTGVSEPMTGGVLHPA